MKRFNSDLDLSIVDDRTAIFWFRRDQRLTDNAGLYYALKENSNVQALFIFDTAILDQLEDKNDKRVEFILDSLTLLNQKLLSIGSSLLVLHGDPVTIFSGLSPASVYANHDYEPYAIKRDQRVASLLQKKNIAFKTYKDQVIFEKDEVTKADGTPYTVFTPYSKQWKKKLSPFFIKPYPTKKHYSSFKKQSGLPFPTLEEIGFIHSSADLPPRMIRKSIITSYDKTRNIPSIHGTTRLGVHLRFGTVSIRNLVAIGLKSNETWLNELIWREFFSMILFHFPSNEGQAFRKEYDHIPWKNDEKHFASWCEGQTGYPLVDAGMRELNATGFMHNRVRMVTASFLTKHLLIDWRWGEAYFAKKLLDYDLASNNGGWQWAAGCGCDAAPYFRIFNPTLQAQRFDPDEKYIRQWVPEVGTSSYPRPMIAHDFARKRAIETFKKALDRAR
jgi:deoxyribodipyrimidine photo-lyase